MANLKYKVQIETKKICRNSIINQLSIGYQFLNVGTAVSEHLKKYNPAQITEIISSSTATIKKLIEVNEGLKLHIFETISSLEAQLEKEKSYSAQIRRELENTRIEYHKDTQKNAARIKELEQMISALNERLKQTMGQIDNAVKWFDNIKGQINSDLLEAMDRAKRILK